jgi:phosphoglucan,water dikinase
MASACMRASLGAGARCDRVCMGFLPSQPLPNLARGVHSISSRKHETKNSRRWKGRCKSHVVASAARMDGVGKKVTLRVKKRVEYGEHVKIVGCTEALGGWNPEVSSASMKWTAGDVWEMDVGVDDCEAAFEFKCVVVRDGSVDWEGGENHRIDLRGASSGVITVTWGGNMDMALDLPGTEDTAAHQDSKSSVDMNGISPAFQAMDDKPELEQWSGDKIVFMQSNEHPRDRQGEWNTQGLEGPALTLVEGDRDAGNWLGKLEVVKSIIVDRQCNMRPPLDTLAYSFVYLTWVSNGSIRCVESGGHHRPNHHARLSQLIFRSLEWVIGERPGTADALFARRMQTRIPSFTDEFMQSTPLTRIRDIAHRNDIPQDLKREIKHTIQNKLHRNAGPEDLAASEALMKRIMNSKDDYSDDFVNELQIFLSELRDFFNAGTLEDALLSLSPSLDEDSNRLIDAFILSKRKVDSMQVWDDNTIMDCMHALTTVRAMLSSGLSAGLRNDAPEKALSMRQKWRLAEIRAEDYIFMLLSRFMNSIDEKGGSDYLVDGNDGAWALPIGALVLSLRHIGLSGYKQSECMALENELMTWQQMGGFSLQDEARRMSSTLNRVIRLTEAFCSIVIDSVQSPALTLGACLGVEQVKSTIFSESEIRSSVAFQTSKLASLLLKASQRASNMPPWQVIRQGECSGVLVQVDELSPHSVAAAANEGNFIAVVKAATGDEELVSLSDKLQGVILLHDIPHLSHLGVRARQEKLTFVASNDASEHHRILSQLGNMVTLSASGDGVSIEDGIMITQDIQLRSLPGETPSTTITRANQPALTQLSEALVETSGAKAFACRELVDLADHSNSYFCALDGLVVPFGSLESVIEQNGLDKNWSAMLEEASNLGNMGPSSIEGICERLQDFVMDLNIPRTISVMIGSAMSTKDPDSPMLIFRSSANVEDLEGLSGAGLYDSVMNVSRDDPESIETAIKKVWASLFSRRAMSARHSLGIHPKEAHMAVLVQPQLAPNLSYVLHTKHPLVEDAILAEIAPGQGEILASGTRGSAWRLTIQPNSVLCDSFANFSEAYIPDRFGFLDYKTMDYSRHDLSCSVEAREIVGKQLGVVGKYLENMFGEIPQDVEGAIIDGTIYVLQARPQP